MRLRRGGSRKLGFVGFPRPEERGMQPPGLDRGGKSSGSNVSRFGRWEPQSDRLDLGRLCRAPSKLELVQAEALPPLLS